MLPGVLWCAVAAYGWWAVGRPPFSASATAAVVGAGVVAMVVGARWRIGPGAVHRGNVLGWAVVVLALAGWQLQAYVQEPRDDHPTLSSLIGALVDTRPERAVLFLAWLVVARELARR